MTILDNVLNKRLAVQQAADLYRQRLTVLTQNTVHVKHNKQDYLSFCSNDYLGLANHPLIIKAFKQGAEKYGVGGAASCLTKGYSNAHQAFEEAFAEFVQRDKALLFANGYMANIGVLQALVRADDVIYADKLNHASLIDAGLLTRAKIKRYKHGATEHLQHYLQASTADQPWIVSDGVFSMEGSLAPLPVLTELAAKYQAALIIDDAHGIGVLGKTGRGILEHYHLSQTEVPVLICSLAKAFGCMGGIVAGSKALIENLIQFARTYIYTTALPPAMACAAKASLELIKSESWRREKLQALISYFKKKALASGLLFLSSDTAIQSLIVKNSASALKLSYQLFDNGFLVSAIRPPTVPANTARLRFTLSCLHEEYHIDQLFDCLNKIYVDLL